MNHLTNNSDNQDILRTLFQANNNIVLNQMYYNQYNMSGNNDNINPIQIKKAVPLKAQISLIKKSLKIVY